MGPIGGVPEPISPVDFGAKAAEGAQCFGAIIKERRITGD